LNNCFRANIRSLKDTADVAVTGGTHVPGDLQYTTLLEMQPRVLHAELLSRGQHSLSNDPRLEQWHCATSIGCVSIFTSTIRDQVRCNYIVTHNVLADVWEPLTKEEDDRYDERID
jgi:hypothetical protein